MTRGQEELLELIQNASENTEGLVRTDAVRRLKRLALRQMDAIALAEFARKAEDPAWRTTAAQVLGYHRAASSFSALVDPLTAAAAGERDPEARRALVFSLQGSAGAARLIDHVSPEVASEALMGLPETREGWSYALDAYFSGLSPDIEVRLLEVLHRPDEAAGWILSYLMTADFPESMGDPSERAFCLMTRVDQGDFVRVLLTSDGEVTRTTRAIWPGIARRERRRVVAELFAESVAEVGVTQRFALALVETVSSTRHFWDGGTRAVRLLLSVLASSDTEPIVVATVEKMKTVGGAAQQRLTELLVQLGHAVLGSQKVVRERLDEWADAPRDIRTRLRRMPRVARP